MAQTSVPASPGRGWERAALALLIAALLYQIWGATLGWMSLNMPGGEFRQTQTAISAYFIQKDRDFSLAYPTPVLGKPWSIPMEFPLYQWTVVAVSDVTKMPLTQAGRAVSLACFYLTLPALWLLMRGFALSRTVSLVGLATVIISPFYMFYSRAFLIETMALMFAAWFLAAYLRWMKGGGWIWLVLANVGGVGAGLVKVTTFMLWLAPAAVLTAVWLWQDRADGKQFRARFVRGVVATLVPFALTLWWLKFADATKALNPAGRMLMSSAMTHFNFGDWSIRVSGQTWKHHWVMLKQDLFFIPGLVAGLVAVFTGSRLVRNVALASIGCFLLAPQIFPFLFSWHQYYYVATAVFLFAAIGIGVGGLFETRCPKWLAVLVIALVFGGQIYRHLDFYYPGQKPLSPGGSSLTVALEATTFPDEVLVVAGDDWNSMIPYYSKRKAFMVRQEVEDSPAKLQESLAALQGEKVGALVLIGVMSRGDGRLVSQLVDKFGLDSRPVYQSKEALVYLASREHSARVRTLAEGSFSGVTWAPGAEPQPENVAGEWHEVKDLARVTQQIFRNMTPMPTSFYSSFGPGLDDSGGIPRYNAHPLTRLRFKLPAGKHRLLTTFTIREGAYENVPEELATDGVEVKFSEIRGDEEVAQLFQRLFAPTTQPADRGPQPIDVSFELKSASEVELFIGPGPAGRDTRDWAVLGILKIE